MALVLGRKEGESIIINDNIKIKVIREDAMLRFIIDAPKDVKIYREEVFLREIELKGHKDVP